MLRLGAIMARCGQSTAYGVAYCVLDIPVPEIGLERPRIMAYVGQHAWP